jgi:hemolysin activation/secretion protein
MKTMNDFHHLFRFAAVVLILNGAIPAFSQIAPDAGRVLKENSSSTLAVPRASTVFKLEAPLAADALPGGATVTLQSIFFEGNTLFSEVELKELLGGVVGQKYDLAGLKGLANQITAMYRSSGYPFARAFIPVQPLNEGALTIKVIEGRYDEVKATGDASLTERAQKFLAPLKPGDIIESKLLERITLILDDQPGIKESPIIRPGREFGTGALDVNVERKKDYGGEVGFDNYGNRYTGKNRVRASGHLDSFFTFGDQINASAIYTSEKLLNGNLGYSLPIGSTGLRGSMAYAHTYYQLGKEFADSQTHGTADIVSAVLSYPLIRSQQLNLSLSGTYQHNWLNDQHDVTSTHSSKSSEGFPISLNFDSRDGWAGGGLIYGSLVWTTGRLNLDSGLQATDTPTAKTAGSFAKINLDVARIQALPGSFSLFGKVSGQWARNNLDSSEGFGLGGSSGVRAYPTGEAYGNEGLLTQIELRYATSLTEKATTSLFAFYDSGSIVVNRTPWDNSLQNTRHISGAGLGARTAYQDVTLDATLAWRNAGGLPTSDSNRSNPLFWLSAGWKF